MDKTIVFNLTDDKNLEVFCVETDEKFQVELRNIQDIKRIKDVSEALKEVIKKAEEFFGPDIIIDNLNNIAHEIFQEVPV